MAICPYCLTQNPDHYVRCPSCDAVLTPQGAPMQQPPPVQGGYIPPAGPQQEPFTSMFGWLGWYALCYCLPVLGTIIMLCTAKDSSAKNYAKVLLLMQCITLILVILLLILFVKFLRYLWIL